MGACQTISNAKKLDSCTVAHHLETTKCKNFNRTNKVSYTKGIQIAFIINPNWIQGKWEGSYRVGCRCAYDYSPRVVKPGPTLLPRDSEVPGRAASGSGPEIVSTWADRISDPFRPIIGALNSYRTRTTCTGPRPYACLKSSGSTP